MGNIIEYKDTMAFQPGYYITEIIEDMGISQDEFAQRLEVAPKTIDKLTNGQCNLSNSLAQKLSIMLDTGIEVWLNIQRVYDKKTAEIEQIKFTEQQKNFKT